MSAPTPLTACLFNLIIYTNEPHRTSFIRGMVLKVMEKFPCRILFIEEKREDKDSDYLKVSSSNAVIEQEGNKVACDLINFEVTPSRLERIPFVLTPKLVPDLPIYLFWGQDPTQENPIFNPLRKLACKLIFDSESAEDLFAFSKKMLYLVDHTAPDSMDTQWAALSSWRDIIIQAFDTEERIELLRRTTTMKISFNRSTNALFYHPRVRSLFLQGWIAGRMGWRYLSSKREGESFTLTYEGKQGPVNVHLIPEDRPELNPGRIFSFTVETEDGYATEINRLPDQSKVVVKISKADVCDMPYVLPIKDLFKSSTFMREVFYSRCSSHYHQMLRNLIHIPHDELKEELK